MESLIDFGMATHFQAMAARYSKESREHAKLALYCIRRQDSAYHNAQARRYQRLAADAYAESRHCVALA